MEVWELKLFFYQSVGGLKKRKQKKCGPTSIPLYGTVEAWFSHFPIR